MAWVNFSRLHGIEAELGEVELEGVLVEDAEHGLLAEDRGQDRHAEVDLARVVAELDAAVLGHAALGDVEVGHDLEPRDDRRLQALGRGEHLVQHAVDAEADAEDLLVGLPVDVGGALADRVDEHHVDELHDRRLVRGFLQLEDVDLARRLVLDDLDAADVVATAASARR